MRTLYLRNQSGDTVIQLRGKNPMQEYEQNLKQRGYVPCTRAEFDRLREEIHPAAQQDASGVSPAEMTADDILKREG